MASSEPSNRNVEAFLTAPSRFPGGVDSWFHKAKACEKAQWSVVPGPEAQPVIVTPLWRLPIVSEAHNSLAIRRE
jgi:hypothetical protein